MQKIKFILFLMVLVVSVNVLGQKTLVYSHEEAEYKSALKLFEKEKYSSAQRKFKKVFSKISNPHSEVKMSAEYYHAVCALELFNGDAELLFVSFIENYPQSPKIRLARFQLGRYYYRKKEWRKSMNWFDDVDVNELEQVDVPEYYFKLAYASYKIKEFSKAQKYFNEAKQLESVYRSSALFYYSFLSYKFNFNETALKGFEQLKEDESFGPVVPYYIIQIYYLQKKYSKIMEYGPGLVEIAMPKRVPEIARIVAEGFYRANDYVKTVQYLEIFMEKGYYSDSTSNYQMAYSYYKTKQFKKAIPYFQKTSGLDSELGQLSLYYLGEIYLNNDKKSAARSAFRFASKSSFNSEIKESALLNYAKLSYELDIDPYHESIIALERYIDEYPGSSKEMEARKYLLNVYLNTKNYQRAIVALDKIKNKDLDVKYAYQKISYFRGIELFNNEKVGFAKKDVSNYKAALFYFQKSLDFPVDNKITALTHYWKAEAYYRIGDMNKALTNYALFKNTSGAILMKEYNEVDYQLGYCYLGLNDYGKAINAFRKYIDKFQDQKEKKVNDAYIRTGDSYLIIKGKDDLILSLKYYKEAVKLNMASVDYVYFQMAQAYMLLNQYENQAASLEKLITEYPESKYLDEAKFILGETYLISLENYDLAIKNFTDVVEKHNGDILLVQKAHNGLATAYSNKKNYEKALLSFENAIALNPRSSPAANAVLGHKSICQDNIGDAQRHIDFRSNVGLPDMSLASKDSSVFYAAKKFYMEKDYGTAIKNLNNYINTFPKALFVNTANYFLAESYLASKDQENALVHYEKVVNHPAGEFTERSVYYSAKLLFEKQEYSKAINRYSYLEENSNYESYVLEARIGLMRAYRKLSQHQSCAKYAELVEKSEKVSNLVRNESVLHQGLSYFDYYSYDSSMVVFKRLEQMTQSEMGAEAKYYIAYIKYLKEKYDESINEVYDLAKKYPSYKKWVTKGFILMSDNFVKQNDYFQAKYVLKTVVDNYKGEGLVEEATEKLKKIEEKEQAEKVKEEQEEEDEIKVGEETEENKDLFTDEKETEDSLQVEEPMEVEIDTTIKSTPSDTIPNE